MGNNRRKNKNKGNMSSSAFVELTNSSTSSASLDSFDGKGKQSRRSAQHRSVPMPALTKVNSNTTRNSSESSWSSDFKDIQEDSDQFSFRITWNQLLTLGMVVLIFAGLSIFAGMAAGLSISVHYGYETSMERVHELGGHFMPWRMDDSPSKEKFHPMYHVDGTPKRLPKVMEAKPTTEMGSKNPNTASHAINSDPEDTQASATGDSSSSTNCSEDEVFCVRPRVPRMNINDWVKIHPKLCSDGTTMGYDSWSDLQSTVRDINLFSTVRFERWQAYFVAMAALPPKEHRGRRSPYVFDDDSMYYEQEIVLTICPGAALRAQRRPPIFVNTENLLIECDGCSMDGGKSHLSFGPDAKNVVVRGMTFTRAKKESIQLLHNGPQVVFEDCRWSVNHARVVEGTRAWNAIKYSRCTLSDEVWLS